MMCVCVFCVKKPVTNHTNACYYRYQSVFVLLYLIGMDLEIERANHNQSGGGKSACEIHTLTF